MPDVWSEIMSARLARREVTRRHADAAMGKAVTHPAPTPVPTATPAPTPVKEIKPEPVVTEEAVEEEIAAPAPKPPRKSAASTIGD